MEITVPINANGGTNIMDAIRRIRQNKREEYLRAEAKRAFNGVIHNCCKVSANNHKVAYAIYRSVFGFPRVEQIERPKNVDLSEKDDCVIVKDGYVYELTRRVE